MRLFNALPVEVLLSSIGFSSPLEIAVILESDMFFFAIRYHRTWLAFFKPSVRFSS